MNTNRAIYCMHSVYLSDIIDDGFGVPMRVVDGFECSDDFAVVLRFDGLAKLLEP